jgi:hypothetical protein
VAYKGQFRPVNKHKYKGDVNNIIYRSRWEFVFMKFCDKTPEIIEWSSEEFFIPYRCRTDGKIHRYFPDFKIKWQKPGGKTIVQVIEIKPKGQTEPPKKPPRMTKRYLNEAMTYAKNKSKWEACREYCKNRGYDFKIMTEKELGLRF